MINEKTKQEMLSYYDEVAGEYDQLYVGKGAAIQQLSRQYVEDVIEISQIVAGFGTGHLIDIGSGTGFWALHYAKNCDKITFLDQSESMLAKCKRRIHKLGLTQVPLFRQGNFFDVELEPAAYDCAFVGFLLSHLTLEEESAFFKQLNRILKPYAQLMVIDSHWSERRHRLRKKEDVQERTLGDGRRFKIYKKYFDQSDIEAMFGRFQFTLESLYAGDVFIAAIGSRAHHSQCETGHTQRES